MDTDSVRQHAEAHGEAIVRGDMDAVTADFVPELRPQVPKLVNGLPQPSTSAEVPAPGRSSQLDCCQAM